MSNRGNSLEDTTGTQPKTRPQGGSSKRPGPPTKAPAAGRAGPQKGGYDVAAHRASAIRSAYRQAQAARIRWARTGDPKDLAEANQWATEAQRLMAEAAGS